MKTCPISTKSSQLRNQYWRHRVMPGHWPTASNNYLGTFHTWRIGVDKDLQKDTNFIVFKRRNKNWQQCHLWCDHLIHVEIWDRHISKKKETVNMIFYLPTPSPLLLFYLHNLPIHPKMLLETKISWNVTQGGDYL